MVIWLDGEWACEKASTETYRVTVGNFLNVTMWQFIAKNIAQGGSRACKQKNTRAHAEQQSHHVGCTISQLCPPMVLGALLSSDLQPPPSLGGEGRVQSSGAASTADSASSTVQGLTAPAGTGAAAEAVPAFCCCMLRTVPWVE